MHFSSLLALALAVPALLASSQTLDAAMTGTAGRKYFGTAADPGVLSDAAVAAVAASEFGAVTPENSMKWDATEASQDTFTLDTADALVEWAQTNSKLVRGHTLVWHSQLPAWVSALTDKDALTAALENHVTTLVKHFAGKIYAWDVVNEIFNEDGTFRDSVFYNVLGVDFVALAFRAAAAADPAAKLYINDYNLDYSGPKLEALISLVNDLIAADVPIHGIGSQAHLVAGASMIDTLATPLQALADTGLEVALTELDIRVPDPADEAALAGQQGDYEAAVGACVAVEKCVGVSVWGVSDKDSWIPDTFSGYGEGLLFDDAVEKKPAYEGAMAGMGA
ncbi:glycosyl hydrolase family 10 protein [Geopyxis carbonaria]|nr:glycosyl hydrolase family 10 protein [Geopyxis carbonaria]